MLARGGGFEEGPGGGEKIATLSSALVAAAESGRCAEVLELFDQVSSLGVLACPALEVHACASSAGV